MSGDAIEESFDVNGPSGRWKEERRVWGRARIRRRETRRKKRLRRSDTAIIKISFDATLESETAPRAVLCVTLSRAYRRVNPPRLSRGAIPSPHRPLFDGVTRIAGDAGVPARPRDPYPPRPPRCRRGAWTWRRSARTRSGTRLAAFFRTNRTRAEGDEGRLAGERSVSVGRRYARRVSPRPAASRAAARSLPTNAWRASGPARADSVSSARPRSSWSLPRRCSARPAPPGPSCDRRRRGPHRRRRAARVCVTLPLREREEPPPGSASRVSARRPSCPGPPRTPRRSHAGARAGARPKSSVRASATASLLCAWARPASYPTGSSRFAKSIPRLGRGTPLLTRYVKWCAPDVTSTIALRAAGRSRAHDLVQQRVREEKCPRWFTRSASRGRPRVLPKGWHTTPAQQTSPVSGSARCRTRRRTTRPGPSSRGPSYPSPRGRRRASLPVRARPGHLLEDLRPQRLALFLGAARQHDARASQGEHARHLPSLAPVAPVTVRQTGQIRDPR